MKRTPPNLKSEVWNPKSERIPLVAPQFGGGGKPEIRARACKFFAGAMMGVLLVVHAAWAASNYATPYAFTTIAGYYPNYLNQDGTGTNAQFHTPTGVTMDTNGNLYVVDNFWNTVRKVAPTGTNWVVTTIAGTAGSTSFGVDGTNGNATFDGPNAIAADLSGNLYVADAVDNVIRLMTPVGTNWVVTTIAGTPNSTGGTSDGTNGAAEFSSPSGIAVDTSSNVYVADSLNNTIRKVTPVGTNWVVTTIAGAATNLYGGSNDGTNLVAQFSAPEGLACDASGNIFVADSGNGTIREITPVGTNWVTTTIAGNPMQVTASDDDGTNAGALFVLPFGVAVDTNENVYVADDTANNIRKLTPVGTNWVSSTLAGPANSTFAAGNVNGTGFRVRFSSPWGIAINDAGSLFVADSSNDEIREGISASLINLTISSTATNSVVVTWWPGAFATLQTNASLASGNWSNYLGAVVSSNGTNSINLPATGGSMFFQLTF